MSSAGLITKQQAGIAIGIEPVAVGDGVGIGPFHAVETAESGYQHEQRRTRQVEIGQENIDRSETISRGDEDRGLAGERLDGAVFRSSTFQKPQRRSAD